MATDSQVKINALERLRPYQFKKGQSGNPLGINAGRPVGLLTRLKRILNDGDENNPGKSRAAVVVDCLYDLATSPGPQQLEAIKEIFNRIEGKPLQRVELAQDGKRDQYLGYLQCLRDALSRADKEPDDRKC